METRFGKFVSGKLFTRLFLILYAANVVFASYVTERAVCRLTGISNMYGAAYVFFTLTAVMVITAKNTDEKKTNSAYRKGTGFISCFIIYYFIILFFWEVLAFLFRIPGRAEAAGVILSICVSAATVFYGYMHTKTIKSPSYTVDIGDCGVDFRIVLISDIHLGVFVGEKHVKRIVSAANALSPDLVVIAGDIFDADNGILSDGEKLTRISRVFREIKSKEGVYAVLGNHDPNAENEALRKFLQGSNIRLLHNEATALSCVNLLGRTDSANNIRGPIDELIGKADTSKPIIVLDHDPKGIREAAEYGADLVLCGHTHRGQFFPVTLFTKWANGKDCFYGHEMHGKTHAVISSGAGFFRLPVRVGTNNEIADIHLML